MMIRLAMIVLLMTSFAKITYAQEIEKVFVYDSKAKRDPFWSLVTSSGVLVNYDEELSLTEIDLQGIMSSPDGGGVAIINGRIYDVDNKIGQYTILKIKQNSVTLSDGNRPFELKLKKEE